MTAPFYTKQILERPARPSAALSAQLSVLSIVVARASFGIGSGRGLRA